MNKVSDAIITILTQDEGALHAYQNGWLNLSAYAESIKPEVERLTWKEVKKGTIVTALIRYRSTQEVKRSIKPNLALDDLSLKSPLCDVTFERTSQNIKKVKELPSLLNVSDNEFLTITQSLNEITIIAPQVVKTEILTHFEAKPKAIFDDLVGLTVRFPVEYLDVPNVIYAIMAVLAVKRINVIEIVSTCTELSLIIHQNDTQMAISVLQKYLGKTSY